MGETQIKRIRSQLDRWPIPSPMRRPIDGIGVLVSDVTRSDLLKQASAMAYVTLLSLVPSLVAIFCVFSLFTPLFMGSRDPIQEIKSFILANLAAGSGSSAVAYLEQMLDRLDLKTIGWSSFASVLVTLVMLLRQIEIAINKIWFIKKSRNVFVRFMYFWTFMTLSMLAAGALVGLTLPQQVGKILSPDQIATGAGGLNPFLQWFFSLLASTLFFFLLYKIIPNCKVYTKPALIGAGVAALLLNEGGHLYGIFVRDSGNYKTLYGALAQLPIFLMWLYVCWTIILFGALISWRVQEGFPVQDATSALEATRTPENHYRNLRIRGILPPLALLAVCRHYLDASGRGLSSQAFAHHVDIPLSWAYETFELLLAKGLIHATKSQTTLGDQLEMTDPCVPAFPPDQSFPEPILASLDSHLHQWLDDHRDKINSDTLRSFLDLGPKPQATGQTLKELATGFAPLAKGFG